MSDGSGNQHRRRRRWGRWLLLAAVLLLGAAVGAYLIWTRGAGRALEQQVAEYRAAGEPIELTDLRPTPPVPDEDNAALMLRSAARIDASTAAWKAYEKLDEFAPPLTDAEAAAVRAAVAENGPAFEDVDEAMKRSRFDWQIPLVSPALSTLLPDLAQQRELAQLIMARALLRARDGDDAGAVADLKRVWFIGRGCDFQPVLVSHMVAMAIRSRAAELAVQLGPRLRIGDGAGEVPRRQVAELVALLLDDREASDGLRRGLLGERALELDTARCLADGRLGISQISGAMNGPGGAPAPFQAAADAVARPMALGDGLLMIRWTSGVLAATAAAPNWPAAQRTGLLQPPDLAASGGLRHILARMMMPAFQRSVRGMYEGMTDAHLAAAALAARLYAADHGGALPPTLAALVPAYLPAVPLDAMASGQPLRYSGEAKNPIVYSVGRNGIDDGGSDTPTKIGRDANRWEVLDVVAHLTPQPRAAAKDEGGQSATQAASRAATQAASGPATRGSAGP